MNSLSKEKVENSLRVKERAFRIEWGEDSCTAFDANGIAIDDYMIEEEDGEIYYTPVSNPSVTLIVE